MKIVSNRPVYATLLVIIVILSVATEGVCKESIGTATGHLWTADTPGFGNGYIGFNGGHGSDLSIAYATIAYGFSDETEGRLKYGFTDPDFDPDDMWLTVGLDVKYEVMDFDDTENKYPFDFALGGHFEIVYYGDFNVKQYGLFGTVSIPYRFTSGLSMVLYFNLGFRLEVTTPKDPPGEGEIDYRVGGNLGTRIGLTRMINLYVEAQFDGNSGLYAGADFKIF